MTRKAHNRRSGWFAGAVVLCVLLGIAWYFVAGGEPVDETGSLQQKFEQCFREAREQSWQDVAVPIFRGSFGTCTWSLFPDDSKVAYTIRSAQSGRTTTIHFYDFATGKRSEANLFTAEKEEVLSLGSWRISPDSKKIWMFLERTDVEGWGSWLEWDIAKGIFDRESKAYSLLWDKGAKPIRHYARGPVWSWPDMRLFHSDAEARNAGVKTFWENRRARSRRAELLYKGILFEFITGDHRKGHLFEGGKYVTSVSVACPWLVQDCWFIQDGEEVALYKFLGHGKGRHLKLRLGPVKVLRVQDVLDKGILLGSQIGNKEYLDLVPLRVLGKGDPGSAPSVPAVRQSESR